MDIKETNNKIKSKIYIKINPKIIINEESDLNFISLDSLLNEKLLNFKGDYFNELYEEARYEEQINKNKGKNKEKNIFQRYHSKNSDLFQIDEYNEIKNINKINREIKSDNIINNEKKKIEEIINKTIKKLNINNNPIFKLEKINFEIKFDTLMGQSISIIGSNEILGKWNESRALNMNWNEGNIWKANIDYGDIKGFEYKFIFMENGHLKEWESGINRIFSLQQIKNLIEPNLLNGKIIRLKNIMNQSLEYNYNDYSLTIISEWNKK
jgi:hypothetical protein